MSHYPHSIIAREGWPRVDVYLPLSATVKVAIGDKVSATSTMLAVLADN